MLDNCISHVARRGYRLSPRGYLGLHLTVGVLFLIGAFVMILLIGFSRLYLGAHYLSDVLGAFAAGVAWLALSLTAVDTLRLAPQPPSIGLSLGNAHGSGFVGVP